MPIRNRLGPWERKRLKELMGSPMGTYDSEEVHILEEKAKQEESWWGILWPLGSLLAGSALMYAGVAGDVRLPQDAQLLRQLGVFLGGLFTFGMGVWMMVLVIRIGGTDEGDERAATAARAAEEYYANRRKAKANQEKANANRRKRRASGRKSTGH